MLIGYVTLCLFLVGAGTATQAQQLSNYTVLQAGGIYGVTAHNQDKPMNGYQFQFVFGKHLQEKTFFGLGIGADVYRGKSVLPNGQPSVLRKNTLPIFLDFRQHAFDVSILGKMGLMASAGYAPSISGDYFRGFMGKAGITYSHLFIEQSDLQFTLGMGTQQFASRFLQQKSHQYHVFLTVGLFVY